MPIKPENLSRYPKDWPAIREAILERADNRSENCDPDNLAAWCQRHHLAYDQEHHITTAYMTRRDRANTMELPL